MNGEDKKVARKKSLKQKYLDLKSKYQKKKEEYKKLESYYVDMKESIQTYEKNFQSINDIYSQVKDWVDKNRQSCADCSTIDITKPFNNAEFSAEYQSNNVEDGLEEIETNYQEMWQNFNLLVSKYKMVNTEKKDYEKKYFIEANKSAELEKELKNCKEDLHQSFAEIQRHKLVESCLVDNIINTNELKTVDKHRKDSVRNSNPPCIRCEPTPTFARFLNKYS